LSPSPGANTELRDFLRSRRARITPGEAGLAPPPGARRVPGQRREEVAQHHPVVGDLTLNYESLTVTGDPGQNLGLHTADPGSPSEQALRLLASWASDPAPSAHPDCPCERRTEL
jgi:MmyB-like transcription regulator ligand binding domain